MPRSRTELKHNTWATIITDDDIFYAEVASDSKWYMPVDRAEEAALFLRNL